VAGRVKNSRVERYRILTGAVSGPFSMLSFGIARNLLPNYREKVLASFRRAK
jgi:hypothetical protein